MGQAAVKGLTDADALEMAKRGSNETVEVRGRLTSAKVLADLILPEPNTPRTQYRDEHESIFLMIAAKSWDFSGFVRYDVDESIFQAVSSYLVRCPTGTLLELK